ncbi:hypothetical protein PoB_001739700 [Plakobranchus ocellatus]|uniref:Uncharacterized protein n=1 Tax=Plakobranchus ocellatus TaxID=259542 RepID=A0AAV3Z8P5_9GAST|nr:hypothetical protein PoB_001739700 [Plakobranchus ocellatus]
MTGYFSKLLDLGFSSVAWLGCNCTNYHAKYSVVHENPRVSAEGAEHDDVRRLADERYDAVSPVTVRLRNKQRRLSESFGSPKLADVGGTLDSEPALRFAGILLSRVQAPPPTPWPVEGPESLKSPRCGLTIHKKQTSRVASIIFLLLILCRISWTGRVWGLFRFILIYVLNSKMGIAVDPRCGAADDGDDLSQSAGRRVQRVTDWFRYTNHRRCLLHASYNEVILFVDLVQHHSDVLNRVDNVSLGIKDSANLKKF